MVGDILGTGVYALTGKVAAEVGGAVWLPFLVAFIVALLTAFSYLELVTKYPQAAGAALYTHKAFGMHFLTFMVTFAVMCSGLTSASSASKAFAGNFSEAFDLSIGEGAGLTALALGFMTLIALVNFRGVSESVKLNVVLTCVELTGLLIVIGIGAWALGGGNGDTVPADGVQRGGGRERLLLGHRGHRAGVLRHGGLRGLGEHGRGDQGPGPDLPQGDADRLVHHRADLRAGVHLGGRPGRRRRTSARATPRC